jgi:DNA helicase-2/ATP-dependent DNA helicase PcrA
VAQLLPGIGPGTARNFSTASPRTEAQGRGMEGFCPPAAAVAHWQDFVETMSTLHLGAAGWPSELDLACRWYLPFMEQCYEDTLQR